jgi:hypothetical protein
VKGSLWLRSLGGIVKSTSSQAGPSASTVIRARVAPVATLKCCDARRCVLLLRPATVYVQVLCVYPSLTVGTRRSSPAFAAACDGNMRSSGQPKSNARNSSDQRAARSD